jgi:hypothetical protein
MGQARKSGKRSPGFIDSVMNLTERFYEDVIQHLTAWRPPAPKLTKNPPPEEPDDADGVIDPAAPNSWPRPSDD